MTANLFNHFVEQLKVSFNNAVFDYANGQDAVECYGDYLRMDTLIHERFNNANPTKSQQERFFKARNGLERILGNRWGLFDEEGTVVDTTAIVKPVKRPVINFKAILGANLLLAVIILIGVIFSAPVAVNATENVSTDRQAIIDEWIDPQLANFDHTAFTADYAPIDDLIYNPHSDQEPFGDTYTTLLACYGVQTAGYERCADFVGSAGVEYHLDIICDDLCVGDVYICTMADMGTSNITDDMIINIRYCRPDLVEQAYNERVPHTEIITGETR